MTDLPAAHLLAFEVGGCLYGLPIGAVLEVAELGAVSAVPTLSARCVAVANWNGEALPMIAPSLLLDLDGPTPGARAADLEWRDAAQVLVLAGDGEDVPWLGLPVDAVLELVERTEDPEVVVDVGTSLQDGRTVCPLDPDRLAERARHVIEGLAA